MPRPAKPKAIHQKVALTTNTGVADTVGLDALPKNQNYAVAALVDPNKPLTQMERAFATYWAQGESITTASARAGYASHAYGYRLVRMPNVLKIYEAEKLRFQQVNDLTKEKVFAMLKDSFDMAKMMSEPMAMVAAAREIGKMAGYYEPVKRRIEVNFTGVQKLDQLQTLSNDELAKLVGEQPDDLVALVDDAVEEIVREDEDAQDSD